MSNNLTLPQVSASQNQKEVTINEQSAIIDAAITEEYAIVGDTSPTLTATEFAENISFTTDGTQTASVTLTVLSSQKKLFLVNNLLNSQDMDVVKGATTVTVSGLTAQLLYSDGTANGLAEFVPDSQVLTPRFSWFAAGTYTSLEFISTIVITQATTLPALLTGSQAYAEIASTGAAVFDIRKMVAQSGL